MCGRWCWERANIDLVACGVCSEANGNFNLFKMAKKRIVKELEVFLISNFRRVLNVVCFLFGNSPASEVYMPTFRNTVFHFHRQVSVCRIILHTPTCLWRWNRQSVPKRRHINFRRRGITQKKTYKTRSFFEGNVSSCLSPCFGRFGRSAYGFYECCSVFYNKWAEGM
jgi:hypothetical protein